jgi:nondiscriminating aspartyl-tRNA synthetase
MERTLVEDTLGKVGEVVKLQGFADTVREMGGKLTFIDLRDTSGKIQCVAFGEANNEEVKSTSTESVIEVVGLVKQRPEKMVNKDIETGTVEIEIQEFKLLSKSEPLPIQPNSKAENETEVDVRMDYRWIDLRNTKKSIIFKVWTELERSFREYWIQNRYTEIHSPKILGAPSESGAEVFEVKYFDRTAYLAQSPQFYKQMAMAAGFERVFEVGPVFRAENSNTIRHATEFTGFDAEISFIDSHEDVMKEIEQMVAKGIADVKANYGEQIKKELGVEIEVPALPFPRLTMKEIKEILGKLGIKSEKSGDLSSEEERELGKYVKEELKHDFVFVTEYPAEFRAFYHMRKEEDNTLTKGFDLVFKGLEIVTGAQREHRYETLKEQALQKGLKQENIQFYLDFFRYGCPPHGGFGMGPGRVIMKMLGLDSIRESSFLFRNPRRLNP